MSQEKKSKPQTLISSIICPRYLSFASNYIKLLQTYEQAPLITQLVLENSEPEALLAAFSLMPPYPPVAKLHKDWDKFYIPIESQNERRKREEEEEGEEGRDEGGRREEEEAGKREEEGGGRKVRMFIWPNSTEGINIFDLEDLGDDVMGVVMREGEGGRVGFVWKGGDVDISEEVFISFIYFFYLLRMRIIL